MIFDFRGFLRDFRLQVALVLLLVWTVSLVSNFSFKFFIYPVWGIFLVSTFDILFATFKKEKIRFPAASLVTGLILGFILLPFEQPFSLPLAALAASFSKQFIQIKKRHVFNPASFGAVFVLFSLNVSVSWWVPSASPWTIVPIVLGMGYILFRLRRLPLLLTFLITYGIYLYLRVGREAIVPTLFDPTTIFFSFVMVPELATSPASGIWRLVFGPLVAIFAIIFSSFGVFSEVFLPGLLLANLLSILTRRFLKLA